MRVLLVLLCACSVAKDTRSDAGTLVGSNGRRGATGPGRYDGSEWIRVDGSVISLVAPSGCADGALLAGSTCSAPAITQVVAGNGINASSGVVSVRFGSSATDVRPGDHTHVGETWLASTQGPLISVNNTAFNTAQSPNDAIAGIDARNAAINVVMNNGTSYHAAAIGVNTAGGTAVLGDSTQASLPQTFGEAVAAQASGVDSAGVYGEGRNGAVGIRAETDGSAPALYANNKVGGGLALSVIGHADLGQQGVLLPIVYADGATGPTSLAVCPNGTFAISGGCMGGTTLRNAELNESTQACSTAGYSQPSITGPGETLGYHAFCCMGDGNIVARAVCLRVY